MDLSFFAVAGTCFFGLIAGAIVSYMAREELESGERYFNWLRKFLLVILSVAGVYFFIDKAYGVYTLAFFLALPLMCLLVIKNDAIVYGLLGTLLWTSHGVQQMFGLVASLIFLYGLPSSALILRGDIISAEKWGRSISKILMAGLIFLGVAGALYLANNAF